MMTINCVNCGKPGNHGATGHVNLLLDGELIIVICSWCSSDCCQNARSSSNPLEIKLITGFHGEWKPWMGLRGFAKNNKLYDKLIKIAEPPKPKEIDLINI